MILIVIKAVFLVSLIAAALAALLAIGQYFLANYGLCEIKINDERTLTVEGGDSLLSALISEKIFIPSACGGRGTCGLCKLKVLEGAGALLPTEEPYLDDAEKVDNVCLSCQVKVHNNLVIEIPPELFAIREYTCKCTDILELNNDMKQFRFELLEPETVDYVPGQYMQLLAPVYEKSGEEVYRAYSISSDPADRNIIELIIRLVPGGICTTYCFEYLKVGDEVQVNGPYGYFGLSATDAPIIFIAGGSGIAPIKCLLHQMKNNSIRRKAIFYFGANKVEELCLLDCMKTFEEQLSDFSFVPVVASPDGDKNWNGETGLVTEAVKRDLKNTGRFEAYLCGSPGMIDASIAVLTEMGMSEENIFYDKFA